MKKRNTVKPVKITDNYLTQKNRISNRITKFPMFFAFNEEQLKEGMKKLKVTSHSELLSIGAGGFIRKKDREAFREMMKKNETEHVDKMKDEKYVYNMFRYELANHEYCITYDYEDTLDSLGLTMADVQKTPLLKAQLEKATKDYLKECRED